MITKTKIAKFLIVLGFLLSITNYNAKLIDFYHCNDENSIAIEEFENSEENEGSEKENFKEKDMIFLYFLDELATLSNSVLRCFPEFHIQNSSVFLEHTTLPPQFI